MWAVVTVAVFCVVILLLESTVTDPTGLNHAQSAGLRAAAQGGSPPSALDYPYALSASLFPTPSQLNSTAITSLVRLISLSSSPSSFGLLNVSGSSSGPDKLWYSVGSYSPLASEAILKGSACVSGTRQAGNCINTPTVPVLWSSPAKVASSSSAFTANALVAQGSNLYAAATTGGGTSIYSSTNGGATWSVLASGIGGTVEGLVTNVSEVAVLTLSSLTFTSTVYSLGGTLVGSSSPLSLTGSGITGVPGASFAVAPVGKSWSYAIAAGVYGPHHVEVATSSDGIHYTSFSMVANINTSVPNAALSSVGATRLYPAGGIPGQVALTAIGSGMLLLFTTRVNGEVSANVLSSPSGGTSWLGPYRVGSTPGTVQDPQLTPSLAGTVYATWRDVANGTGTVAEAVIGPTGGILESPSAVPGSSLSGLSPIGAPAVAVDSLQRPLVVWPALNAAVAGQDVLAYSGGFLPASVAATQANLAITDPLVPGDFGPGAPGNALQVLENNVANVVGSLDKDISNASAGQESGYCNSQNVTVLGLYPNLTTIPLSYSGSGTVCAAFTFAQLHPRTSYVSPILGPLAPNTYLAVYADWVLEAVGIDVTASPLQAAATAVQPPQDGFSANPEWFAPPAPVTNNATVQGKTEMVTVTPTVFSPTALQLTVSSNPIPTFWSNSSVPCYNGKAKVAVMFRYYWTYANKTWLNASLNNGTVHSFTGTSAFVSSIFLTNLTPLNNGSARYFWKASFSVAYAETENVSIYGSGGSYCGGKAGVYWIHPAVPASLGPIVTNGGFWTELTIDPSDAGSAFVTAASNDALTVGWTNTADSNDTLSLLNDTTQLGYQNVGQPTIPANTASPESYQFSVPGTMGDTYTLTLTGTSRPGHWIPSEQPAYAVGSASSSAETATDACTFTLSPPSETLLNGGTATGITSTSATITWQGTVAQGASPGPGFVTYYAVGTGVNLTDDQVSYAELYSGHYQYVAVLHGLDPWTNYSVTYGISDYPSGGVGGCLTDISQYSIPQFLTNYTFPLWEQDQPYDSISHTGGGATIGWELPAWFLAKNPTWASGSLNYTNSSGASVGVPLSPSIISSSSSAGFEITLPLTQPNTVYTANVSLVYQIGQTKYYAFSPVLSFVYLRDTSGDGLTDAEKNYGWAITYESASGSWTSEPVWANPALYATNGLVSDYIEKEYDLNSNTIDTAGSHMLDTWNLTFSLGTGTLTLPSASLFHYWYENGSDPFTYNVTPTGLNHRGWPIANNSTGSPHWTSGGLQDDNPYDAEVLWTGGAVGVLENLITWEGVGWLRGVIMHGYNPGGGAIWTLTVWGKLSWGANPLAASTPNDGLADGTRVSPLYDVGVLFSRVYSNDGPGYGLAYAVKMNYTYQVPNSGLRQVTNYSSEAFVGGYGGNPATVSNYAVTLPVGQTAQIQTINLSAVLSVGGRLVPVAINGSSGLLSVMYDLVGGQPLSISVSGQNSSTFGNLSGTLQVVAMGVKVPTWLWVPTTNSTVNGLPTGLERYTGEQSFDIVVADASSSFTSYSIPMPWGGYGSKVSLSSGLNAFLIPREQFLASPFGQAILLGKNASYNASRGAPPLVNAPEQSYISGFGGANLMVDLGAYWQNRSIASASGGDLILSSETGTPLWVNNRYNPLVVQPMVVNASTGSNTGGLFSDTYLYNASDPAPPAVQSIITLNITSNATLNLLLAALIDNTSGGSSAVNGTFQSITYRVGFLGLNGAVVNAVPNVPQLGDGLYGPPSTPLPVQSSNFWANFWNAVTSVITNPGGFILSLVSTVWNVANAAWTYATHVLKEAIAIGGQVLSRVAATLVSVGRAIVAVLEQMLNFIVMLIEEALSPVIQPVVNAMNQYTLHLTSDIQQAYNDSSQDKPVAPDAAHFWADVGAPLFIIVSAVAVVITAVITFIEGFSLGTAFLIPIIVGFVINGGAAALADGGGPSFLSDFARVNPVSPALATEWEQIFDPPEYLPTLGTILGIETTAWAAATIESDWEAEVPIDWTDEAGLATGFLGLVVADVAYQFSATAGAVASLFFDGSSCIFDAYSITHGSTLTTWVILAMDTGTVLIDAKVFGAPV